jgi:hypothetical protein
MKYKVAGPWVDGGFIPDLWMASVAFLLKMIFDYGATICNNEPLNS